MKFFPHLLFLVLNAGSLRCDAATVTLYGPTPYSGRADSPFYEGIQRGTILVEDFEDLLLNTPGVTITPGGVARGAGVDEDDGVLNGIGYVHNWFALTAAPGLEPPFTIEIRFTPDGSGTYPAYVGLAMLGFVHASSPLSPQHFYQFFDAFGNSLTPGPLSYEVPRAPDDDTPIVATFGNRFVGAYSDAGISRIILGSTDKLDHLQFGYSIPEPATGALMAGVLLLVGRRRR